MKIDEYYLKVMSFYDELARLKSFASCECKKYECNLALKLTKEREEEIIHQFLMGFDGKSYGAVRTNLLAQQPLGDLNRAYQTLVQEEQSHTSSRDKPVGVVHAFHIADDRARKV